MLDEVNGPHNFPPITDEDLARLEVEPQLIPFVVSAAQRVEKSSSGEPQLTPTEAENLVEILDTVVSSNTVNPGLKDRCFKVLRRVSPAHGILPKSYHLAGVTLSDNIAYASGGSTDIWKGKLDGRQVCVKAFRTQVATNLDKIKQRFYRDILGWKYIAHPNVVPFSGVSETLFSFSIINPWLPNGNILDCIQKNQRVNRLQLLAQAACGLEYLHSLGVVHSGVNPGNILIDEDGVARLGDFGIAAVISDPTIVEQSGTTTSASGVVRYKAPELLYPLQFNLKNSNPTKESDIYSFAMVAYEVLTEIVPYGNALDSIIVFHVLRGDRPPRPQKARWLRDETWDMIHDCWSEQRELRWDARTVFNKLSLSSTQETAEVQREVQTTTPSQNAVENPSSIGSSSPPLQNMAGERLSIFVEERGPSNPSAQPKAVKSTPKTTKKRFMFPGTNLNPEELETPYGHQVPRPRRWTLWSLKRIQPVFKAFGTILRPRKFSRADGPPSG